MAKQNKTSAQIIPFPIGVPNRTELDSRINWLRSAEAARNIDQSMARRAYLAGFFDATLKNGVHHA